MLMTNLKYFSICLLIFTVFSLHSTWAVNDYNVRGKVIDENTNEPLTGVSVVVANVRTGTLTDENGNFQLNISSYPATLYINYVGYQRQQIQLSGPVSSLSITLKEGASRLSEVVVTALGITKEKKSLGYTTQMVNGGDINGNTAPNLVNGLAGKLAGVRVTNSQGDMGSSRIVIRGETSIGGRNDPLFVVDGVPVDNSQFYVGGATRDFRNTIADLNPADIESISVLKGPNAAALYGSRAAHGVILITSKSGKGKKGFDVNVNSGVSFSRVASLPDYQNVFGQGSQGKFSYVDGKGGGVNDGTDESWGPKMDGSLIPQFFSNGEAVPFVAHPDNVKDFFQTGVTYDNSISIAGSDEKFDFRLGVNNQNQKGTVPNTQIKKTNFSINTDYHLTKRVKVGVTANYILTDVPNLPGGPSGNRAAGVMLQFLWFGRQVDMAELKKDWTQNWNNSYYSNPYWRAYYNTVEQQRNRIIGDVHAEVNLATGLDFRFRTGTDYYNDARKYKIKYGTNGTPYGSYSEDRYNVNENNTEAILTYKKNLSSDWNLDALGGFNLRNNKYENNYQQAPRLAVPDLYTLTNSRDALVSKSTLTRKRVYSAYASGQLGYKGFAFLNVTARNDWSSTLPASNRSYFYPSVNGSLVLTDALNIRSAVLDFLKVRGGWSEVGSDGDPYQLNTIYNFETAFDGNPIQTSSGVKNNPNLKPEITRSTELGAELGLFGNRVHIDLALYNTNSINQILTINTSAASGYTSQLLNAGKINNKGLELQLDVIPVKLKDFKWNVGANYSINRGKVKVLDDEGLITNYTTGSSGTTQILASVGKAYGSLFGSVYKRDSNGNIIVGTNGLPSAASKYQVLGHYTPDWIGGITNSFTYKNIQLTALIDASIGGKIYSGTNRTGVYTGVLNSTLPGRDAAHGGLYYSVQNGVKVQGSASSYTYEDGIIVDGVTSDGSKNTTIVSAEDYYHSLYNISEAFIYKSSFVKLREIQLTYTLPKSFIAKIGLKEASVTAVGRNLFFLYKDAPNIDPEVALNTGNAQGVESLSLPTTRTLGFNVSLKF